MSVQVTARNGKSGHVMSKTHGEARQNSPITSLQITSCHVTSSHDKSRHVSHDTTRLVTKCHVIWSHAPSFQVTTKHATTSHFTTINVIARHDTPHHGTTRHTMARHVTSNAITHATAVEVHRFFIFSQVSRFKRSVYTSPPKSDFDKNERAA